MSGLSFRSITTAADMKADVELSCAVVVWDQVTVVAVVGILRIVLVAWIPFKPTFLLRMCFFIIFLFLEGAV